jgi:hypothetical protein
VRPTRVRLNFEGTALKNEATFFDLHIEEDPARVIEVTLSDPHFTFLLDGERIPMRLPAGLPLDEAERRVSQQLGRAVYIASDFPEGVLRETNRVIELAASDAPAPEGAYPPPAADVPPIEFDRLTESARYPAADGAATVLYTDEAAQEQWVLAYPAGGRFAPIPPDLQPLAALDHPAVLAVRSVTGGAPPVPLYGVEYTVGTLATLTYSDWDNTTMTIAIVGLVLAVRFLHYRGIAHGAIRPANAFVNRLLEPKLGPAGSAALDDVAVAAYTAPEVRAGAVPDHAADIFSLAVTVYEVATNGRRAFPARSLQELDELQGGAPRPEFPDYIEPSVTELLSRAWASDPAARPTAVDIFNEFMQIGFLPITLDDVDGKTVVEYVTNVVAWETRQGIGIDEEI